MRKTDTTSAALTLVIPRNWRLFFVVFLVRIWRLKAWPRLTVPPGRTRKRFLALLFVFILGMTLSVPGDSSIFYMIAGGNTSLRLDAYSHLFGGEIEFAAFVKTMP